ncbi:MAG: peptide chain release factor N(5)-glutamine methyltransferase [bacterium]|nr:peptide chain release factor N(5)-glutamine methyltransferase [bacterium]MBU1917303.1 peptide chain release factor N(5)-glutamine methyltransferase [bacterium]
MTEQWIIKKLLTWTTDYFTQKDIPTPRLDAEILLAHLLQIKKIDLYLQFDRSLLDSELAAFKQLVKRRVQHEPVAYMVGKKEFWSRDFIVSKDVLIPRPETEHIVDAVIDYIKEQGWQDKEITGYEVGLGSGCLAITLLCELPNLKMTAIEISDAAVEIAKKNAKNHGVLDRLEILCEDFLTSDPVKRGRRATSYDLIVSNPPYIAEAEKTKLPQTVRDFEPIEALFADQEGLVFYPTIANFSKNYLRESGFVAVEIGETQGPKVAEFFQQAGLQSVAIKKDYAGLDRVVVGIN